MNDIPIERFQRAIRATHSVDVRLLDTVRVVERYGDRVAWEGDVLVFEVFDHPSATRCYAWEVDGRVTAVLHEPPVDSPEAAVRAAIVAEHRGKVG